VNAVAKKISTFKPATTMKNEYFYWMNSEGLVTEVPWGEHCSYFRGVLNRLKYDGTDDIDDVAYAKGWLRIGIEDWCVDDYGTKVNRKQRRAIADWIAIAPTKRSFAGNCDDN
jgi:hypothetical protein